MKGNLLRDTRPTVTTDCFANGYAAPHERIVEFSGGTNLAGGLISFTTTEAGRVTVNLYRLDDQVDVVIPANKIPPEQRHGKELLKALKAIVDPPNGYGIALGDLDYARAVVAKAEGRDAP